MKFAKKLSSELTEEWKDHYLNYDELKLFIKRTNPAADNSENIHNLESESENFEKELINLARIELSKINSFYINYENKLKEELQILSSIQAEDLKCDDLEKLYFKVELIKNYSTLNFTGFENLFKKIHKILPSLSKSKSPFTQLLEDITQSEFNSSDALETIQSAVIKYHSLRCMNGNRKKSVIYLSKLWSEDPRNQPRLISERLASKKGFIIDMDGVIYHGNKLLPGAIEFVKWLTVEKKNFLFLTNSSSLSPKDLQKKLFRLGIQVSEHNFYTSSLATANFLASQTPNGSAYVIGDPGLVVALYDVGYSMNDMNPDYVVVGETRDYNFARIEKAVDLVRNGARLIGTNIDIVDKKEGGFMPACGSLIAPIEAATGVKPYFLGKPNPLIIRSALEKLKCRPSESCIIGDRMDTDIIAGIEASIDTVLVLSGVTAVEDLKRFAYRPHLVLNGIGEVPKN